MLLSFKVKHIIEVKIKPKKQKEHKFTANLNQNPITSKANSTNNCINIDKKSMDERLTMAFATTNPKNQRDQLSAPATAADDDDNNRPNE
jgi:hypothetical protein